MWKSFNEHQRKNEQRNENGYAQEWSYEIQGVIKNKRKLYMNFLSSNVIAFLIIIKSPHNINETKFEKKLNQHEKKILKS